MTRISHLLLFLLLAFSLTADAAVGIYQRAACTSISAPVIGKTWCFEETTNTLKLWNGTTWAGIVGAQPVSGNLDFATDNAFDIGNPALTTRPRGLWLASTFNIGTDARIEQLAPNQMDFELGSPLVSALSLRREVSGTILLKGVMEESRADPLVLMRFGNLSRLGYAEIAIRTPTVDPSSQIEIVKYGDQWAGAPANTDWGLPLAGNAIYRIGGDATGADIYFGTGDNARLFSWGGGSLEYMRLVSSLLTLPNGALKVTGAGLESLFDGGHLTIGLTGDANATLRLSRVFKGTSNAQQLLVAGTVEASAASNSVFGIDLLPNFKSHTSGAGPAFGIRIAPNLTNQAPGGFSDLVGLYIATPTGAAPTNKFALVTEVGAGPVGFGALAPTQLVELEEVETITGAVADGFAGALRFDPGYTAATAQTVTRHNYIELQDVSVAGAGPAAVTDAAVMRFDAAAGTHKAVDAGTTKTSPGIVNAWIKININGTIHFVPSYTSKTS